MTRLPDIPKRRAHANNRQPCQGLPWSGFTDPGQDLSAATIVPPDQLHDRLDNGRRKGQGCHPSGRPPPSPEGTLPGSGGQLLKLHGGVPDTGRVGLLPLMLDADLSARANRNQPVPCFEPTLSGGTGRDKFCGLAVFDRSLPPLRSLWSIDSRHRTGPRYRPSGPPRFHNKEPRPDDRRTGQSGVLRSNPRNF